jgi:hypothetical protein
LTLAEDDFVAALLAGLDAWPAYYAHMAAANLAGPAAPDLSPPEPADPAELRRRIDAGEWVVDLRSRTAFAAGHLPGSLSSGLDGSFATYLGWLIPWGAPLTLLGETADQVAEAQRERGVLNKIKTAVIHQLRCRRSASSSRSRPGRSSSRARSRMSSSG